MHIRADWKHDFRLKLRKYYPLLSDWCYRVVEYCIERYNKRELRRKTHNKSFFDN